MSNVREDFEKWMRDNDPDALLFKNWQDVYLNEYTRGQWAMWQAAYTAALQSVGEGELARDAERFRAKREFDYQECCRKYPDDPPKRKNWQRGYDDGADYMVSHAALSAPKAEGAA